MREPDEHCDLGAENGNDRVCTLECRTAFCGDGFVFPATESCDDGNYLDGDRCPSDCAQCGDGRVSGREACDDGDDTMYDDCNACARPGQPVLTFPVTLARSMAVADRVAIGRTTSGEENWVEVFDSRGTRVASIPTPDIGPISAILPETIVGGDAAFFAALSMDVTDTRAGGLDIMVASYAANGAVRWRVSLAGPTEPDSTFVRELTPTPDGGVLLGGYMHDVVSGPAFVEYGLVVRFGPIGARLWRTHVEFGAATVVTRVAEGSAGTVCAAGYEDTVTPRYFIACFSADGVQRWLREVDGEVDELRVDGMEAIAVIRGVVSGVGPAGVRFTIPLDLGGISDPVSVSYERGTYVVAGVSGGVGQLYLLRETGERLWNAEPGRAEGIVWAELGNDGRIYALRDMEVVVFHPGPIE